MRTFFFHLHDGLEVSDDEGIELPDLEAARRYALTMARFEASEAVKTRGRIVLSHRIDVEDETGAVVATVHFRDAVTVAA